MTPLLSQQRKSKARRHKICFRTLWTFPVNNQLSQVAVKSKNRLHKSNPQLFHKVKNYWENAKENLRETCPTWEMNLRRISYGVGQRLKIFLTTWEWATLKSTNGGGTRPESARNIWALKIKNLFLMLGNNVWLKSLYLKLIKKIKILVKL